MDILRIYRIERQALAFDSNRIGHPLIRFESNAATRDSLRIEPPAVDSHRIERALSRFDINRMPMLDRIRFEFDRTAG